MRASTSAPTTGSTRGVTAKLAALAMLVLGLVLVPAAPALAACHHFSVKATPDAVTEGGTITATVSRDGSVGPSNIDISTVDGTAKAGTDYVALHQTVNFTSETSQQFPVKTMDDGQAGGPKTFKLHLSNPGGCTVNPNFVVDPDATATINDNGNAGSPTTTAVSTTGARATTTAAKATTTTRAGATTTTAKSGASTTAATTAFPSTEPSTSTTSTSLVGQASGPTKKGGSGVVIALLILAIVAVAGGGGYALYRMRRPPPGAPLP